MTDSQQPNAPGIAGPPSSQVADPPSLGGRPRGPARFKLGRIGPYAPTIALIALCALFTLINSTFLTIDNFRNIIDASAILMTVAVGLTFVILIGGIDLSVEGVIAASSVSVALLVANDHNGNNLGLIGVILAILVGTLFGLANGLIITRVKVPSFMATLGTWSVGLGVATVFFGGRVPNIHDQWLRDWELVRWFTFSPIIWIAVGVVIVGYVIQRYTRVGRYAYVIGGNEELAIQSGINVNRYKVLIFMLSGTLVGLSAVMVSARLGIGDARLGANTLFAAVTAVVIGGTLLTGGRGGVLQTVIGVLIVNVINNGMVLAGVDPYLQKAVQGAIIVGAVTVTTWPLRSRLRMIK